MNVLWWYEDLKKMRSSSLNKSARYQNITNGCPAQIKRFKSKMRKSDENHAQGVNIQAGTSTIWISTKWMSRKSMSRLFPDIQMSEFTWRRGAHHPISPRQKCESCHFRKGTDSRSMAFLVHNHQLWPRNVIQRLISHIINSRHSFPWTIFFFLHKQDNRKLAILRQ